MEEHVFPSPTREPIPLDLYPNGILAIVDREIVDHDTSLEKLEARIRRRRLVRRASYLWIPPPEVLPRKKLAP